MNIAFVEIKRSYDSKIMENLFLWLSLTVCFVLLAIVMVNTQVSRNNSVRFDESIGSKNIYMFTDLADTDNSVEYFTGTNEGKQSLKNLYDDFHKNQAFRYYVVDTQPLVWNNQAALLPDFFNYGYEAGVTYPESGRQIKSFQLSQSVMSEFSIKLQKGVYFTDDDYIYNSGQPVSVILGSEYAKYFNLGSEFQVKYLGENITAVVKGFFAEQSLLPSGNDIKNLDRYIILPFFSEIKSSESRLISQALALDALNGDAVLLDPTIDLQKEINKLSIANGTFFFSVYQWNGSAINVYYILSKKMLPYFFRCLWR